jgi:hypothetical protein
MAAGDVKLISTDRIGQAAKKAAVFDGNDDYVSLAGVGALNYTKGTFSAWVNIVDASATYCVFSVADTDAQSYISLELAAGKPQVRIMNAAALKCSLIATTAAVTTSGWHHVAVTQDAVKPKLYLDGVLCDLTNTDTTDTTYWMNSVAGFDNASIGILAQNSTLTLDYAGGISDVKMFNVELTAAQILDEFNGQGFTTLTNATTGVATGLIAWWDFNTNYLDDVTGGGTYTGTASGATYLDANYSELSKLLNANWVAAGDGWEITCAENQIVVLHIEGV